MHRVAVVPVPADARTFAGCSLEPSSICSGDLPWRLLASSTAEVWAARSRRRLPLRVPVCDVRFVREPRRKQPTHGKNETYNLLTAMLLSNRRIFTCM